MPDKRPLSLQLRTVSTSWSMAAAKLEAAADRAEAEAQELATELADERTAHQETLAVLKRLRPWADFYEDHMGPPEFAARGAVIAEADELLAKHADG